MGEVKEIVNHVDAIAELKGIGASSFYSVAAASVITGLHRHVLDGAIKDGALKATYPRDGMTKHKYITSNELQRWIDSL